MDDPGKVMIAISFFASAAYSIRTIARAVVAHREKDARFETGAGTSLTDARLARIEQSVDAIALEVERISEGQRFTTKLLSERVSAGANEAPGQLP